MFYAGLRAMRSILDMKKPTLPVLMSLNAGFVDTAGFLALQGLFTAHVTGNFVTLGASLVQGTSGAVAKLLALPVFCVVIIVTRMLSFWLSASNFPVLRTMLSLKFLLLLCGAVLAIHFGPFPHGDSFTAILTGMVLVAAMAIQNAAHRIHLGTAPPTTLMTGTTTQIMIDFADLIRGVPAEARAVAIPRLRRMGANVIGFAAGCALAALFFAWRGNWCFVVPPLLAFPQLFMQDSNVA